MRYLVILSLLLTTPCFAQSIDRCVLKSGEYDCVAWKDEQKVLISKARHESRNVMPTQTEKRQETALQLLEKKHQVAKKHYDQQLAKQSVKVWVCDFEGCGL